MKILLITSQNTADKIVPLCQSLNYEILLHTHPDSVDENLKKLFEESDMLILELDEFENDALIFSNQYKLLCNTSWKPVVVLSGENDNETLVNALASGADIFVQKPVNAIKLIAQIKAVEKIINLHHDLQITKSLLEQIVITDPMTNVANRRGFVNRLDLEWHRAKREKNYLSALMIDIDYFKEYNDTYGHGKGDDCLILVASTIQSLLNRKTDLIARYGGDEFVVLLPNTNLKGAQISAEKIKSAIYNANISNEGSEVSHVVTVSIGVCCSSELCTENQFMLISSADSALYEAKHHGRNTVCSYYSGLRPESNIIQ